MTSLLCLSFALCLAARSDEAAPHKAANPFYAMDTSFRGDIPSLEKRLDLLKELGYSGVAWTEASPAAVKKVADECAKRGLKIHAIYCSARVTPEGDIAWSPMLPQIMSALEGHGSVIWLHLGGKGPAFDALTGKEPMIPKFRELSAEAEKLGQTVAIYPHVGEWTERVQDAVKVAKAVDRKAFGVTFNLCHCLAKGDEVRIAELLTDAGPYLKTVTINGADSKGKGWDQLIQPLDKGSYDVGVVLRTLKKMDYQGPIGFQGYGIRGDTRAILVPTIEAWKRLAK